MTVYSTRAAAAASGATYRQLDYWARVGIIGETGGGSGSRRRWTDNDLETLRVLFHLSSVFSTNVRTAHSAEALAAAAHTLAGAPSRTSGFLIVRQRRAIWLPDLVALVADLVSWPCFVLIDLAAVAASPAAGVALRVDASATAAGEPGAAASTHPKGPAVTAASPSEQAPQWGSAAGG